MTSVRTVLRAAVTAGARAAATVAGWPDDCRCETSPTLPTIGNDHSPPYRRDAVELGPFGDEPFGLYRVVQYRADGAEADAHAGEVAGHAADWMVGALRTAGVELGDQDLYIAALLAHDGWSIVQVVAGWVARAHRTPESAH